MAIISSKAPNSDNHTRVSNHERFRELEVISTENNISLEELKEICAKISVRISMIGGKECVFYREEIEKIEFALKNIDILDKIMCFGEFDFYKRNPRITEYLYFHNTLDVCCWLLKLRFTPKEYVKNKKYRLDLILNNLIKELKFYPEKINRSIGKNNSQDKFIFHLKKGWYNELVRLNPFPSDFLEIGTKPKVSNYSNVSPSWSIIQAYYCIYEFTNSIVFTNTDNLRTEQHRKSSKFFNNNLLSKLGKTTVFYPFNIQLNSSEDLSSYRRVDKKFWQYKYANTPRFGGISIYELEKIYLKVLSDESSFMDFMYKLRVWANYLGIDTIIELEEGYLLAYLYKNLDLLCFFFAVIAEVTAIAFLGEELFMKTFSHFANKYVLKQSRLRENWYFIPPFIRLRIYQKNGLINEVPDFIFPPDPDPLSTQFHLV